MGIVLCPSFARGARGKGVCAEGAESADDGDAGMRGCGEKTLVTGKVLCPSRLLSPSRPGLGGQGRGQATLLGFSWVRMDNAEARNKAGF